MTKNELLSWGKTVNFELMEIRRMYDDLKAREPGPRVPAYGTTPGKSGQSSPVESFVAEYEEQAVEYRKRVEHMRAALKELSALFSDLPPLERAIMRRRYMQGQSIANISSDLNYSQRRIYTFHERALARLWPEE